MVSSPDIERVARKMTDEECAKWICADGDRAYMVMVTNPADPHRGITYCRQPDGSLWFGSQLPREVVDYCLAGKGTR